MSMHSTIEQLRSLRLNGMADGVQQQLIEPSYVDLSFEQRFQMAVNAEASYRETQRYKRIIKGAKLKLIAAPEDIIYRPDRGLDRSVIADLLTCDWITRQRNLLITGATGTGKTWLACALAVQAARKGITVGYRKFAPLLQELEIGRDVGTIIKQRAQLTRVQLLILDDFGLSGLSDVGRSDLMELIDDRVGTVSTIVLGQMPVKGWHAYIDAPAVADAILDRLIHSSIKLELQGESLRKSQARRGQ